MMPRYPRIGLPVPAFAIAFFSLFSHAMQAAPAEFLVHANSPGFIPPKIILQFDPSAGTGIDWQKAENRPWHDSSSATKAGAAAEFVREGIERMTGRKLEVSSSNDLSQGIVFTTLRAASADLREDPEVLAALKNDGSDDYNYREAFFIRSEPRRLLIIANEPEGFVTAAPALLESVGYEVLAMGPNWLHAPDLRERLAFRLQQAGRPSYYIRALSATSGQSYGVGTINDPKLLVDPADETVSQSYRRWRIGQRMFTSSMPTFPGHALQAFHTEVIERMRSLGTTDGFLGTVKLGSDADRPAAHETNRGSLWISTDNKDTVHHSDGKEWRAIKKPFYVPMSLDVSVTFVRELIFSSMKQKSEKFLAESPDETFIFGTDPEDGSVLNTNPRHPNWYTEYLAGIGAQFGKPYVLHGYKGLNQPRELWEGTEFTDIMFGLNNWLLREYDRWIDSLPPAQRMTSTGRSKKDAVRCSFYSYNDHDVPPNFNLDPRIRVMIASYPKNRGYGKWKAFRTQVDMGNVFRIMLPREPSGDYWIISLSYFWDRSLDALAPRWDASPEFLTTRQREHYAAGFRALSVETDFNFGRFGLGYYLIAQTLWNTKLSAAELDALRDRWLKRAFGSGWPEMKRYYDFTLLKNYPVNSPHAWSQAIRFMDAADNLIDASREPAAQRRIDDLKQYWYLYYLIDTGEAKPSSPALRELLWKGQMSYANASHMISRVFCNTSDAAKAAGEFSKGPAHFRAEETKQWWPKVLSHWPIVPVTRFAKGTLANGRAAAEVDVNDLVSVTEFGTEPCAQGLVYNAGYQKQPTVRCAAAQAGDEIGFQLYWPADVTGKDKFYVERDVPYGIERWNTATNSWDDIVDPTMTTQPSTRVTVPGKPKPQHLAAVRFKAPLPGTYRFQVGRGGNLATLIDLGWDPASDKHTGGHSFTFDGNSEGLTQRPTFIYIPKGTRTLDLEVWDSAGHKFVTLYKSLPPGKSGLSRKVDIGKRQTHRIELKPEETGAIAELSGNGFAFPYLYSVPMLWAKSPGQLLVPRAIAEADGLTIRSR
jgi:hypothetical protein